MNFYKGTFGVVWRLEFETGRDFGDLRVLRSFVEIGVCGGFFLIGNFFSSYCFGLGLILQSILDSVGLCSSISCWLYWFNSQTMLIYEWVFSISLFFSIVLSVRKLELDEFYSGQASLNLRTGLPARFARLLPMRVNTNCYSSLMALRLSSVVLSRWNYSTLCWRGFSYGGHGRIRRWGYWYGSFCGIIYFANLNAVQRID